MKNKIIGIVIFLLSIVTVAPMVMALQIDRANPTSKMLQTFSTDSFSDTNKNWKSGLCTGFNDIINPSCPIIVSPPDKRAVEPVIGSPSKGGGSPLPSGGDGGSVLGTSITREPSEETTTTTEEPTPPAESPPVEKPAESPEMLGVSTERAPSEEPSATDETEKPSATDETEEPTERTDLELQKTPLQLTTPTIKPSAPEKTAEDYLIYIILILVVTVWFISRTESRIKKTIKKYFKKITK